MTFISYSQNYEDVMLWRALKNVNRGFYVDVGANDPIIDSVTQAFYERGWRGINIEPMNVYIDRLYTARPRDINLPIAAADKAGELTFYEIAQTGLSTTNNDIAQKQLEGGWPMIERKVMALPLNEIFDTHVKGPIHFLKIDVEGVEQVVLKGLDLTRWRPWILVIEATIPMSSETNHEDWEHLVLTSQYELVYFDGLNRFYVAREHLELAEHFKTPPNFFDGFMTIHFKNTLEDRDRNKAELDRVYQSRSYRITAPMRAVIGLYRVWRDRIKNQIKKNIKRAAIETSKRPWLQKRALLILKHFPAFKQRIKSLVRAQDAPNSGTDFLSEDPASLSAKDQMIYNDLIKAVEQTQAGE